MRGARLPHARVPRSMSCRRSVARIDIGIIIVYYNIMRCTRHCYNSGTQTWFRGRRRSGRVREGGHTT